MLFGIAGLVTGSYLFAELSAWLKRTVQKWGDHGEVTLPELLHVPRRVFIPAFFLLLLGGLFALDHFTAR